MNPETAAEILLDAQLRAIKLLNNGTVDYYHLYQIMRDAAHDALKELNND